MRAQAITLWLFKNDGTGYRLNSLTAIGERLGEKRDAEFEEKGINIARGDVSFFIPDGVDRRQNLRATCSARKRFEKSRNQAWPGA